MSDGWSVSGKQGLTLSEVCLALLLLGLASAAVLPACSSWIDAARLGAASGRMTLLFRQLRYQAIAGASCRGVVFDPAGTGNTVVYRVVRDGNGNGIRRAEVEDGTDPVVAGPVSLPAEHGVVRVLAREDEGRPHAEPSGGHQVGFGVVRDK